MSSSKYSVRGGFAAVTSKQVFGEDYQLSCSCANDIVKTLLVTFLALLRILAFTKDIVFW